MTSKQNLLVQTLLDKNRSLNASQLANQLGISVRTVHNYINSINGEYPGAIRSTPSGYYVSPDLARKILSQQASSIPQTTGDRCNYLLNRLVQSGGSLNLYDLCDEIYISTTTFHSLLGKMRRMTREYDLTLSVSSDTVSLTGSERNKRRLLSSLLYNESSTAFTSIESLQEAFPSIDIEAMRVDILDVLKAHHYFINDYSLINLLLHVAIAINRLEHGCSSDTAATPTVQPVELQSHERELAQGLIERLEKDFSVHFTASESYELALLLVSRATALDYQTITPENISTYIGKKCTDLVHLLIRSVKDYYDIDLNAPEFFTRFALHIHNLMVRASSRSFCKNPLVAEIRQTCPLIYDVSVQLAGIILEQTGIAIDEDEIAYIALHLGGALETQKELASRVTAVLYCPSYYNMDSSLSDRINHRMDSKIVLSNVITRESDLKNIPAHTLVISTVRLHHIWALPVVLISPFLTNTDCIALNRKVEEMNTLAHREKFRANLQSIMSEELFECGEGLQDKEQVIHHMCGRLQALGYADSDFEKRVLEREAMSSTAFGQFAIPHTLKLNAIKTGLSIYISRTPILWDDTTVNLVIMLSFNSNQRIMLSFNSNQRKVFYNIFEPLSMILSDANNLKQALNCNDYHEFIDFLVEHLE